MSDASRWTHSVHRDVLPNGLTVLVQPVSGSPAAAIVTRVAAGFFDEPDEWVGISHVLEHMFFKGTPTRGVGRIARETKAAGGYLNAATSYDSTTYYAVLPAQGLEPGLAIQADALQHALLDPGELGREIQVIIAEAKRKLDSPGAVSQETLHELLFDRHRIRRWRIGTEEGLARLTRDDVVAYYRSRYVPTRTTLALAGAVEPGSVLTRVRELYGEWRREEEAIGPWPEEPARRERRARTLRGDVKQAMFVVGWRGVPVLDPDSIPLDVAAAVLAAGRASRLYRAVREPGLVAAIGAWNFSPSEVGVFSIAAELDAARMDAALAATAAEVARLREHGPTPDELERARTLLRARWARRFETAEGRAMELAAAESLVDVGLLEREYGRLLELTADDVRDVARRRLEPEAVSAVAYLPAGRGRDLDLPSLAAAFDRPAPPAIVRPIPSPLVLGSAQQMPGTRIGPTLHVELPGADILLQTRSGTPTVHLGFYRLRVERETQPEAGLGALSVRSAVRGAGGYDGATLAEAFERLGGPIGPSVTTDWFGFSTVALSENLAPAATLLDLTLRAPRFAAEDIQVERELLAEDARQLADDMSRRPVQLAHRAAWGDQGYGLPVLGDPATVLSLEPAQVADWHTRNLSGGRTTVVAVGDFDCEQAAGTLAGVLADHPAAARVDYSAGPVPMNGAPRFRVEERDKAQSALAMVFPGPDRRAPDRHAAEVWAAWAGGLGGRLFQSLRDVRSLAYAVSAYPWQRRAAGALVTYIATSPDREEEARAAMLSELSGFGQRDPDPSEVAGAINYLIGQAEVSRQSAGARAGEMLDAWLNGTGLEELIDPAAPYRTVTPADVREIATRYLQSERRAEGVVRGKGGKRGEGGGR